MQKVLDAILKLKSALNEEYQQKDAIVNISLTHECFDDLTIDCFKKDKLGVTFRPSTANDFYFAGVKIDARQKQK